MQGNPIRRVVTMLQMMQQKVQQEGKKEKQLFTKFMCYCDTSSDALKESIAVAETKAPQLDSSIKEAKAEVDRLKGDVKQAKSDRAEAADSRGQGKSLHEKEMAALTKEIEQNTANMASIRKAITALEKGSSGLFLQTTTATQLQQLTVQLDLGTTDRDVISAFLSEGQTEGEQKPQSGEILGILGQMLDEIQDSTKKAEASAKSQQAEFEAISGAKGGQVTALGKQIEAKEARIGELGVDLVNLQADYDDTAKALVEDKKFMASLQVACTKKNEKSGLRGKRFGVRR
jgi:DNA repair exonuclease SbcCD ATPase subunit